MFSFGIEHRVGPKFPVKLVFGASLVPGCLKEINGSPMNHATEVESNSWIVRIAFHGMAFVIVWPICEGVMMDPDCGVDILEAHVASEEVLVRRSLRISTSVTAEYIASPISSEDFFWKTQPLEEDSIHHSQPVIRILFPLDCCDVSKPGMACVSADETAAGTILALKLFIFMPKSEQLCWLPPVRICFNFPFVSILLILEVFNFLNIITAIGDLIALQLSIDFRSPQAALYTAINQLDAAREVFPNFA